MPVLLTNQRAVKWTEIQSDKTQININAFVFTE